jgi:acyl-CoA synthetase (AMP-forming)/AMP-acid ligase II
MGTTLTMALLPSEQLHAMAEACGDETVYTVVRSDSITFDGWDTAASRLARGLVGSGVAPGDRVALHLEASNALRWMTPTPPSAGRGPRPSCSTPN